MVSTNFKCAYSGFDYTKQTFPAVDDIMGGRRRTIEDVRAMTNLLSNLFELHVLIFIVDSL